MKGILAVSLLLVFLIFSFAACSNVESRSEVSYLENDSTVSTSQDENESSETQLDEEISYVNLIPDPVEIFKEGEVTVTDPDGGNAYIFNVINYTFDEYEEYIYECREIGFTDVSYEIEDDSGLSFGAYTESGEFWVQVMLNKEKSIIEIICQTSRDFRD